MHSFLAVPAHVRNPSGRKEFISLYPTRDPPSRLPPHHININTHSPLKRDQPQQHCCSDYELTQWIKWHPGRISANLWLRCVAWQACHLWMNLFFLGGGGLFFNLAQKTRKEIKHRQLEAFFYPLLIKNRRHGFFFFSHKHGGEQ